MALKIASTTFVGGGVAGSEVVHKGSAYDEQDPIVVAYPSNFVTPDEWAQAQLKRRPVFGVESASAVPGEKRNVKKPAADK